MAYSNAVIKANNFVVELLPNVKEAFLQAVKRIGPNQRVSRNLTQSNISGIESLSISTTYENIVLPNNFLSEHICDLNNEYELIIGGNYSNYMVNLSFKIINKKEQWSLCCKINFTLYLSQLKEKGLHMVINIPLYGIQVVTSYNCITKDIVISLRLPLIDGNNGDRNNASSNGCTLTCLTVEFNKNKIDQITFGPSPRPFTPPSGAFHGFNSSLPPPPPPPMLPKPKPLTSPVETPPPLPGKRVSSLRESQTGTTDDNFNQAIDKIDKVITKIHDGLFPKSQHNIPNQFQQPQQQQFQQQQYQQQNQGQQQEVQVRHPPVYNTITPPAIPTRPNTFTTQTNGSHYYYSTQTQWSTSYGFGRQTCLGTTQSSTVTNHSTIQQQQYTTSSTNSAPTTPTTQSQPISTTTTSLSSSTTTTTKTEPVRKAGEQFNNVVNRAADGIDKGITKVSNIFSSRKNNPNTTQQQQQNTIVKAS